MLVARTDKAHQSTFEEPVQLGVIDTYTKFAVWLAKNDKWHRPIVGLRY